MASDDPPGQRPSPVVLRIKLRYEDADTMVRRFATNVGKSGLFLPTKSMQPLGSEIKFELRLFDDKVVLVGLGRVKAAREPDPDEPKQAFGLTVELMRVTRDSRELILRMLERRREVGMAEVALPMPADVDDARRIDAADRPPTDAGAGRAPTNIGETPPAGMPTVAPAEPMPSPLGLEPPPPAVPELLTSPRRSTGPVPIAKLPQVPPLAPEPPRKKRPQMKELIEKASGPVSPLTLPALPSVEEDVDVGAALARARALATGDVDAELDALRESAAAPRVEINIEAASAELAKQLGGVAVRRDRSAPRWAPPPAVSSAEPSPPVAPVAAKPEPKSEPKPEPPPSTEAVPAPVVDVVERAVEAAPVVEVAPVVEAIAEPVVEAAPFVEPIAEPVVEAAPAVEPSPVVEAAPPAPRPSTIDEAARSIDAALDTQLAKPEPEPVARRTPEPTGSKYRPARISGLHRTATRDFPKPAPEPPASSPEPEPEPEPPAPSSEPPAPAAVVASSSPLPAFGRAATPSDFEGPRAFPRGDSLGFEQDVDDALASAFPARAATPVPIDQTNPLREGDFEEVENTEMGDLPPEEPTLDPRLDAAAFDEHRHRTRPSAGPEQEALADQLDKHLAQVEADGEHDDLGIAEASGKHQAARLGSEYDVQYGELGDPAEAVPLDSRTFADATMDAGDVPDVPNTPPPNEDEIANHAIGEVSEIEEISDFEILAEADADDADLLTMNAEQEASGGPDVVTPAVPHERPSMSDFADRLDLGDDSDYSLPAYYDRPSENQIEDRGPVPQGIDPRIAHSARHALAVFDEPDFDSPHGDYSDSRDRFERPITPAPPRALEARAPDHPLARMQPVYDPASSSYTTPVPAEPDEFDAPHADMSAAPGFVPPDKFDQSDVIPVPAPLRDPSRPMPAAAVRREPSGRMPQVLPRSRSEEELETALEALDVNFDDLSVPNSGPEAGAKRTRLARQGVERPTPTPLPEKQAKPRPVAKPAIKQTPPKPTPAAPGAPAAPAKRAPSDDGIMIDFDNDFDEE